MAHRQAHHSLTNAAGFRINYYKEGVMVPGKAQKVGNHSVESLTPPSGGHHAFTI
jgi:hypothetical protein